MGFNNVIIITIKIKSISFIPGSSPIPFANSLLPNHSIRQSLMCFLLLRILFASIKVLQKWKNTVCTFWYILLWLLGVVMMLLRLRVSIIPLLLKVNIIPLQQMCWPTLVHPVRSPWCHQCNWSVWCSVGCPGDPDLFYFMTKDRWVIITPRQNCKWVCLCVMQELKLLLTLLSNQNGKNTLPNRCPHTMDLRSVEWPGLRILLPRLLIFLSQSLAIL